MDPTSRKTLGHLLATRRVAALGTLRDGAPFVSMVLVAPWPDANGLLLHVSRLAAHTRDMVRDARVSVMLGAPEVDGEDPQALPRVTIQGESLPVPEGSDDAARARAVYLARFPDSEPLLDFPDFSFHLVRPASARLVAGFARAFTVAPAELWRALAEV
jgi:putative heme iron utilization protein